MEREAVEFLRSDLDAIGVYKAGIDNGRRAGGEPIELHPVSTVVFVSAGGESHAIGKPLAFKLREPVQEPAVAISLVPGVVAQQRIFDVLRAHVLLEESLLPLPRRRGGHDRILLAVEQQDRQVERIPRKYLHPGGSFGADRGEGGPHVGSRQAEPERTASATGGAGEIDAVLVHQPPPLYIGEHVVNILLGDPAIAHTAARQRAGDYHARI